MAFAAVSQKTGKSYILHARLQKLKGGTETVLYYFAGAEGPTALSEVPVGYVVCESEKTGLLFLKKG